MSEDAALVELLHFLRSQSYHFIAVTPATHATVVGRKATPRPDLRDLFGWNLPFEEQDLTPAILRLLERADAVESLEDGRLRSRVRVASLADDLFVHSAFPTDEVDAVFFGPDTYRFVRFIKQYLPESRTPRRIVDMGAGAGAGGIVMARKFPDAEVILADVNPEALRFAQVNATAATPEIQPIRTEQVPDEFDLLVGNAPYLMDTAGRSYRDGGKLLGGAVSLDWVRQGLEKMRPGGLILLYTAAAYVEGEAPLLRAIRKACETAGASLAIDEIDPDVFGEELREPAYSRVERIAAVGIVIGAERLIVA